MSGTKWHKITTSDQVFSEYVLCPADKETEQVDNIYYYTGDYTDIETMSREELQKMTNTSVLKQISRTISERITPAPVYAL